MRAISIPFLWLTFFAQFGWAQHLFEQEIRLSELWDNLVIPSDTTDEREMWERGEEFTTLMLEMLADVDTYAHPFDSLKERINIQQSWDKRLRIYSWDECSGGTWHDMCSVAQFKTSKGEVKLQRLDTDREMERSEYTDVVVYGIYDIKINDRRRYVTLGWGTHGSGMHHCLARVLYVSGGDTLKEMSCFKSGKRLVIEQHRRDRIGLKFSISKMEFTYNQYDWKTKALNRKKLKFSNGLFQ